jgi:electron transport complex protein RnfB
VRSLADLLGRDPVPLEVEEKPPAVAVIDEQACIGCTLCLQACPVDAIVGAAKQLHGVITAECTGCELCLPPCPVDCIDMVPVGTDIAHWRWPYPAEREAA